MSKPVWQTFPNLELGIKKGKKRAGINIKRVTAKVVDCRLCRLSFFIVGTSHKPVVEVVVVE